MRQRIDGTWTTTSPEFDAQWYWPVGTVVQLVNGQEGTVIKQNAVSVSVQLASGEIRVRVPFAGLRRVGVRVGRRVYRTGGGL